MRHHEPIQWIRNLYPNEDEEDIVEAEENFRALITFLADLGADELDEIYRALTVPEVHASLEE